MIRLKRKIVRLFRLQCLMWFVVGGLVDPLSFCKEPLIIREFGRTLGQALMDLKKAPTKVTKEIVLVWNPTDRRIITGSDVLGLLFKGV